MRGIKSKFFVLARDKDEFQGIIERLPQGMEFKLIQSVNTLIVLRKSDIVIITPEAELNENYNSVIDILINNEIRTMSLKHLLESLGIKTGTYEAY